MGVTIKQIAEMAGVHRSTVDKVLHKRKGVSESVRKRVQKIIDECNYQANPIGKALKMQDKELKIGIILLEVDALPYLKTGIMNELAQYQSFHIDLSFCTVLFTDAEQQAAQIRDFRKQGVHGIIISPINDAAVVREIDCCKKENIPVITVNTDIKGSERLCFIGQDGFKAGRIAGRLMGEFLNGCGKTAIFTSDGDNRQSFPFGTREDGFREILAGSFPEIEIMPSILTQEKPDVMMRETRKICEEEPEIKGIFITCGGVRGVGEILRLYDKNDICLICFENYPEIIEMLKEGIVDVTLVSSIEGQGKDALNILLDYLIYNKEPARKHLYSDTMIVLKESL